MFAEFLESHPLESLIVPLNMRHMYPPVLDQRSWSNLPAQTRDALIQWGNEALDGYPQLSATIYLQYARTGNRKSFETPYFQRRSLLIGATLAECVTGNKRYLDTVMNGLWFICEESSWVISAHNAAPNGKRDKQHLLPDTKAPDIDLFSAQTASTLAYVIDILSDELDELTPVLIQRVRDEIEKRIFTPFLNRDDFWWMGLTRRALNNWTPWILSNVMDAFLLLEVDTRRLAKALDRSMLILDRYLESLPEDGGCDEGCGYWNVAGASLLDCLENLRIATGGKACFYDNPLIRAVAQFPMKAHIDGPWYWNFADCDAKPVLDGERVYTSGIRTENGNWASLGNDICDYHTTPRPIDTPQMNRVLSYLFTRRNIKAIETRSDDKHTVFMPNLQVWAMKKDGIYAALKGGNNGESHNHNDVGNVIVYLEGKPAIIDAGNMTYTALTFSEKRYTLWNIRSAYHNLPIIGGIEQKPGAEYRTKFFEERDTGAIAELQTAYPPEAGLILFRRELYMDESAAVTDNLELREPTEVTWVWMLRSKPETFSTEKGMTELTAGNLRMRFSDTLSYRWEEIPVNDERMALSFPGSLFRLLLTAGPRIKHTERFEFDKGKSDE